MPTISVVVPAYNVERTILETIASVLKQTFSDFELIVINDGSTDGTLGLLSIVNDPRLKVYSYENGGLPVARNRGIACSTGEFITFIDGDDLWTPDKLELQLITLQQHPKAGAVYSWTLFMDEKGESFHPGEPIYFKGNILPQLLVKNFIASGSNVMLRRRAIASAGEFDPTLKSCEDWDYWLRVAANWNFVVVPKAQILYRQSAGTMSSKVDVMEKYHLLVIEKAFQLAPAELQYLKSQSLSRVYLYCAELYLRHNNNPESIIKAGYRLWKTMNLYPKILLEEKAQKLVKWFIKKWFTLPFSQRQTSRSPA
jgi:glycosyltransferase involved in cell wall biosynthesis